MNATKVKCLQKLRIMHPYQITDASFFSLSINSSEVSTKIPAFLVEGSSTFTTLFLGVKSMPVSSAVKTSMGFFLACVTYRNSGREKSDKIIYVEE